jgi:hypothetical protein
MFFLYSLSCFCMSSVRSLNILSSFFWGQQLWIHYLHFPPDPLLCYF